MLGAGPEVVVGSVHAVTETGELVIASATGSQLAPYAAGAGKAIWVVGGQKVVPDLATALKRIQYYSYPMGGFALEKQRENRARYQRSS